MKEESNAGFYDVDSQKYDSSRWRTPSGVFNNKVQQKIVAELTANWESCKVIEVGPGTARFTLPIAGRRNRMTLVDVSQGMLKVAKSNLVSAGLEDAIDDCIQGSIYSLPFEDNKFDRAVCLNVFSHLDQIDVAMTELHRVLKPGGSLLVNYPNLESYYWPVARRINRDGESVSENVFSKWSRPQAIERWATDTGLFLKAFRGHVHMPKALEKYHLLGLVRVLDGLSRRFPLSRFAPVHFCLFEKR